MSVLIERPNGNFYESTDADWFGIDEHGRLDVFSDGVRILVYQPGAWVAVEIEPDEEGNYPWVSESETNE